MLLPPTKTNFEARSREDFLAIEVENASLIGGNASVIGQDQEIGSIQEVLLLERFHDVCDALIHHAKGLRVSGAPGP